MVTVTATDSLSGSVTVSVLKALRVALSLTAWLAASPAIVGLSLIEVVTAEMVSSLLTASPLSSTLTVNVVVSVVPGAMAFSRGSKTSARTAVVTAAPTFAWAGKVRL